MAIKKRKALKKLNRKLYDFIKDEGGFISAKNILKIGLGTISTLGIAGSMEEAMGQACPNHDQQILKQAWITAKCYKIQPDHCNHTSY